MCGRADMTKLTVAFRNFVKISPKEYYQRKMCCNLLICLLTVFISLLITLADFALLTEVKFLSATESW